MPTDFELQVRSIAETVTVAVGLATWTVGYCGARLIGGTIALAVWGAQSALSAWRVRR